MGHPYSAWSYDMRQKDGRTGGRGGGGRKRTKKKKKKKGENAGDEDSVVRAGWEEKSHSHHSK